MPKKTDYVRPMELSSEGLGDFADKLYEFYSWIIDIVNGESKFSEWPLEIETLNQEATAMANEFLALLKAVRNATNKQNKERAAKGIS